MLLYPPAARSNIIEHLPSRLRMMAAPSKKKELSGSWTCSETTFHVCKTSRDGVRIFWPTRSALHVSSLEIFHSASALAAPDCAHLCLSLVRIGAESTTLSGIVLSILIPDHLRSVSLQFTSLAISSFLLALFFRGFYQDFFGRRRERCPTLSNVQDCREMESPH